MFRFVDVVDLTKLKKFRKTNHDLKAVYTFGVGYALTISDAIHEE